MKIHRIYAIVLHYWYHSKRSLPRIMDIVYWPTFEIILWGFISIFLNKGGLDNPNGIAFLLGAVILWNMFRRGQQDVGIAFLEDIWYRNVINLFVAPLKVSEYIIGGIVVAFIKAIFIILYMSGLAFFLYHFNLFKLGFYLIPFIFNLIIFSFAVGIFISAIIFRFGTDVQILAFSVGFLVQPISAVFYPVSVLPRFLQMISWALPTTNVFEGLRGVFSGSGFSFEHFYLALFLNIMYIILASIFYGHMFKRVRELGLISKIE